MATWQERIDALKRNDDSIPSSKDLQALIDNARAQSLKALKDGANDVEKYLEQLADGKITPKELRYLLEGVQRDLRAEAAERAEEVKKRIRTFLGGVVTALLKKVIDSL